MTSGSKALKKRIDVCKAVVRQAAEQTEKIILKLKNYIVRWHILNTKSHQHVETREELTTRL